MAHVPASDDYQGASPPGVPPRGTPPYPYPGSQPGPRSPHPLEPPPPTPSERLQLGTTTLLGPPQQPTRPIRFLGGSSMGTGRTWSAALRPRHYPPPQAPPRTNVIAVLVGTAVTILLLVFTGYLMVSRPTITVGQHPPAGSTPTTTAPASPIPVPGGLGVAFGTVISNDGHTLQVHGLGSATTIVRTGTRTQIYTFGGSRVEDVRVGYLVIAHGRRESDGSLFATGIVGVGAPRG